MNLEQLSEKGFDAVTRVEVIEIDNRRVYVNSDTTNRIFVVLQDEGRTLKIFIKKEE